MKSRQLFFATGVLLGALAIGLTAMRFADESKALIEPLKASTLSLNNGWDFEIRNENESSTVVDLAKEGCVTTRSDGTTCNSWVTDGAAHLEVSKAGDGAWRSGMFIETGQSLDVGVTYAVSFDVENIKGTDFEIWIQNKQFDEIKFDTLSNPVAGHHAREFTPTEKSKGELWLYVCSGVTGCEVAIKNLKVEKKLYTYTKEYTEKGLELHVTRGGYDDWQFGLINWNFPTVAQQNYYIKFNLEVDSYGETGSIDSKYQYSKVTLAGNEDGGDGYKGRVEELGFTKDTPFGIHTTFKANDDLANINLQLGAIRAESGDNYTVRIKDFFVKVDGSTEYLHRINYETGEAFANRWKAGHVGKAYCKGGASEATCISLIEDYCALRPEARTAADEILDTDGVSTIRDSVLYFAEVYGIELQ